MSEMNMIELGQVPVWKNMQAEDAAAAVPQREKNAHKGDFGYTALIGGSERYSGAIRLASMANAAMRAGAGVVVLAAPKSLSPVLAPYILESTLFPLSEENGMLAFRETEFAELSKRVTTAAFGMGAGLSEETKKAAEWLLKHFTGTLILDADALNALAELGTDLLKRSAAKVVLTPHFGEMARLTKRPVSALQADPAGSAAAFAREHGCIVLLKGAETFVTDGAAGWTVDRGCPGMATAGSGDVLSGVIAALCGYNKKDLLRAVAAAAYICGAAGEKAQLKIGATAMVASDTARHIAESVHELEIL